MLRLNFRRIDFDARDFRQTFGQKFRVGMILGQLLRALLQRDQSSRRQNSRLPHAAAERLAVDAGAIDQLSAAHQQRAHRRAQSLRQAEHHGVGLGGQLAPPECPTRPRH